MDPKQYVTITEFCACHRIEPTFIDSLNEYGLVEIITLDNRQVLLHEQVGEVEKMIRLHYDLEINLEGIDAISNLLQRVSGLQEEVRHLQNRLKRYEE
ncbi:chaperone modulator CbpM [Salinimicrobium sp. GXAS 041]|uniref:chaperone modulator CbpM n=1 Tax=Salinimicrobium sp. GXAS 041 TaxID=3400806 RepID=UPI003C73CD54